MSSDDSHQLILSPLSFEKPSPLDDWDSEYESVSVATPHGRCEVVKEGHVSGASIITLHDLGLNHVTNFKKLFSSPSLDMLSSHFTIYHVNAPGQELGADAMSEDESYPSMEQLSEIVSFIGVGSGMGGHVLARLGKRRPRLVEALILFNTDNQAPGWIEWARNLSTVKSLTRVSSMPVSVVDSLLNYHLGSSGAERCPRLYESYKQLFLHHLHPTNLLKILQSYNSRDSLKLARDIAANGRTIHGANRTLRMSCLNIVGEHSPHVEATVSFNGRLDPEKCTWMKISDCSMVVVEQTEKVSQAVILYLQGLGYTLRKPLSQA